MWNSGTIVFKMIFVMWSLFPVSAAAQSIDSQQFFEFLTHYLENELLYVGLPEPTSWHADLSDSELVAEAVPRGAMEAYLQSDQIRVHHLSYCSWEAWNYYGIPTQYLSDQERAVFERFLGIAEIRRFLEVSGSRVTVPLEFDSRNTGQSSDVYALNVALNQEYLSGALEIPAVVLVAGEACWDFYGEMRQLRFEHSVSRFSMIPRFYRGLCEDAFDPGSCRFTETSLRSIMSGRYMYRVEFTSGREACGVIDFFDRLNDDVINDGGGSRVLIYDILDYELQDDC